jgi:hypothetical protein
VNLITESHREAFFQDRHFAPVSDRKRQNTCQQLSESGKSRGKQPP